MIQWTKGHCFASIAVIKSDNSRSEDFSKIWARSDAPFVRLSPQNNKRVYFRIYRSSSLAVGFHIPQIGLKTTWYLVFIHENSLLNGLTNMYRNRYHREFPFGRRYDAILHWCPDTGDKLQFVYVLAMDFLIWQLPNMDPTYFQPKNKTIRRLLVSSTDSKLFHENEWSIGVNWNSFFLVQFDIGD